MLKKLSLSLLFLLTALLFPLILVQAQENLVTSDLELQIESIKDQIDKEAQQSIVSNTKTKARIRQDQKLIYIEVYKTPQEKEKQENKSYLLPGDSEETIIPYVQQ